MNKSLLKKQVLISYCLPAVFFLSVFIYVLVYIDPRIIYSCNGFDLHAYIRYTRATENTVEKAGYRSFSSHRQYILELTPAYAKEIVAAPGGCTRLLVTLALYACHYPVFGALTITAVAWLFYFLFPLYIRGNGGPPLLICRYFPVIFLLAVCGWYELNYYAYLLPVIGALLLSIIYQKQTARIRAFILIFWISYYLFQWAFALVVLFVIIHELSIKPKIHFILSIAALLNIVILYILESRFVPVENAFQFNTFFTLSALPALAVVLYFLFAAIIFSPFTARLLQQYGIYRLVPRPMKTIGTVPSARFVVLLVIFAGIMVWAIKNPVSRDTRTIARTLYHIQDGRWNEVLKENTRALFADFPAKSGQLQKFIIHATDHALCRTGRLGEKMFSYPHATISAEPLFLFENTLTYGFVKWAASLELFLDLGLVNFAEKVAGELMECMGPYPSFMHRRALIQIAKGNTEAASVYLHKLSRMPFYRKEAGQLLKVLNDDKALASDKRIAALRACMDTSDYFLFMISEETILRNLLKSNPANKMAYEYLAAYYLQTGQADKVTGMVERAGDLGYHYVLPRHWEEALCMYLSEDSARVLTIHDYPIQPKSITDLGRFLQAYAPCEDDPVKRLEAAIRLKSEFGTTYFYFHTFRVAYGAGR